MTDFPVPEGWVRLTAANDSNSILIVQIRNISKISMSPHVSWTTIFVEGASLSVKESITQIAAMIGGRKHAKGLIPLHANGGDVENVALFFDPKNIDEICEVKGGGKYWNAVVIYGGEEWYVTESPAEVRRLVEEARKS